MYYLALHNSTTIAEGTVLTISDQHLNILTEYCILRAWTERLSTAIQDPTAHISTITQINNTIAEHRKTYDRLVAQALAELGTSRITMNRAVDKNDRIY